MTGPVRMRVESVACAVEITATGPDRSAITTAGRVSVDGPVGTTA